MQSLTKLESAKIEYNEMFKQGNYKEALIGYKLIVEMIISKHKNDDAYYDLAIRCATNYALAMKMSNEPDNIDDLDYISVELIKFCHQHLVSEKHKTRLNRLSLNSGKIYLRNLHYARAVFYSNLGKNKSCLDLYKEANDEYKKDFFKISGKQCMNHFDYPVALKKDEHRGVIVTSLIDLKPGVKLGVYPGRKTLDTYGMLFNKEARDYTYTSPKGEVFDASIFSGPGAMLADGIPLAAMDLNSSIVTIRSIRRDQEITIDYGPAHTVKWSTEYKLTDEQKTLLLDYKYQPTDADITRLDLKNFLLMKFIATTPMVLCWMVTKGTLNTAKLDYFLRIIQHQYVDDKVVLRKNLNNGLFMCQEFNKTLRNRLDSDTSSSHAKKPLPVDLFKSTILAWFSPTVKQPDDSQCGQFLKILNQYSIILEALRLMRRDASKQDYTTIMKYYQENIESPGMDKHYPDFMLQVAAICLVRINKIIQSSDCKSTSIMTINDDDLRDVFNLFEKANESLLSIGSDLNFYSHFLLPVYKNDYINYWHELYRTGYQMVAYIVLSNRKDLLPSLNRLDLSGSANRMPFFKERINHLVSAQKFKEMTEIATNGFPR